MPQPLLSLKVTRKMLGLENFKFLNLIGSGGFGVVDSAVKKDGRDQGAVYAVKKQQKIHQEDEIRIEVQVRKSIMD